MAAAILEEEPGRQEAMAAHDAELRAQAEGPAGVEGERHRPRGRPAQ